MQDFLIVLLFKYVIYFKNDLQFNTAARNIS